MAYITAVSQSVAITDTVFTLLSKSWDGDCNREAPIESLDVDRCFALYHYPAAQWSSVWMWVTVEVLPHRLLFASASGLRNTLLPGRRTNGENHQSVCVGACGRGESVCARVRLRQAGSEIFHRCLSVRLLHSSFLSFLTHPLLLHLSSPKPRSRQGQGSLKCLINYHFHVASRGRYRRSHLHGIHWNYTNIFKGTHCIYIQPASSLNMQDLHLNTFF